ncbi:glutamine-hydrolyzing carbamoyl-phosphate synthase small subunit [Natranaerobius thermophilus]|uniref:Carbamoyl phosphate synthase small chain n=1 Tax=Natranaerobius thermophilus (strain ATCC BAA-1301 / DSM 18059 / JW/NM-WN-LF) TaxID=457570 RepID=B2A169_NATTJ|nr:glutamine-hydrolyzing carbamoyl-phosphate synthase small subunit [Natranaerobius thermophilus]ACB86010.1 carbamoyl-phosphate synthase, small subunit [Natranaerobius thermophilus JW/NM-WN-LF]
MPDKLILEDGTEFEGTVVGHKVTVSGEVVFTTGMTGYQEVLTDPSYCNQIVTFTYPLIGNQGVNKQDFESKRPYLKGIVTKEICEHPSNWQSELPLAEYLRNCKVTAITGVDTRKVTKHIREKGTMKAWIICEDNSHESVNNDSSHYEIQETNLVEQVSTQEPYVLPGNNYRIALLDLGVRHSLLKALNNLGATVIVLPHDTPPEDILSYAPQGIVLSNGPGDPQEIMELTDTINEVLKHQIPLMGVCLGHQLLGLTLGYESLKMKFGHRGINHPVKNLETDTVNITSQNHGYVISSETVPANTEITHINLNDQTVEGIKHKQLPVFSVQFHPEAGLLDLGDQQEKAELSIDKFMKLVQDYQSRKYLGHKYLESDISSASQINQGDDANHTDKGEQSHA